MMKSRNVKAATKGKAFVSKRKLKGSIPLDTSDSGSDVDSETFFHDDIDDFHKKEEDQLSTDDELIQHRRESSEDEEVLPITDDEIDDSDEAVLENDESGEDSEEGLPNPEAWGKRKSLYYSADFVDEDRGRTYREEDAEAAKAEADEAFAIQKSVYSNITANNLGANVFLESSESSEDEEERKKDLASAPKHEKLKFLKKTSPEFFEYIKDFKLSMSEIQERLLPLLSLASVRNWPSEACVEYIKIKYRLYLHLAMNISFYMMAKSSGKKLTYHPVLRRIATYKKFLEMLKPIDDAVQPDIDIIVEKFKQNEEIILHDSQPEDDSMGNNLPDSLPVETTKPTEESIRIKKSKRKNADTETEREIVSLISNMKEEMKKRKVEEASNELKDESDLEEHMADDEAEDEKRTITYQISKNKGLTPHRKKEYRNPRVKHRIKFRKAEIRRKGQVRERIKEVRQYRGEPTGISTHVVKSRKFK